METADAGLLKICRLCGQEKNLNKYGFHSRDKKYKSECKKCAAEESKEYRIKNREKYLKTQTNTQLKKRYNFSLVEYNVQLKKQDNKCAICKTNVPGGGHIKRFAVDHCHTTGEIRGLLCSDCNRGLGFFKDNGEVLFQAIQYLNKSF